MATTAKEIQEKLKVNQSTADSLLDILNHGALVSSIEGYDPEIFEQLNQLDAVNPPEFDIFSKNATTTKVNFGFGFMTYGLLKFCQPQGKESRGEHEIDMERCFNDMKFTISKTVEIPSENEQGEITFDEGELEIDMVVRAHMYREKSTNLNVITFTNLINKASTNEDFNQIVTTILSQSEYWLSTGVAANQDFNEYEDTILSEE